MTSRHSDNHNPESPQPIWQPELKQNELFESGRPLVAKKNRNGIATTKRDKLLLDVENAPLNEQQRRSVNHSYGPLLVVAGPGSGKTSTMTYRFARLVAAEAVAPGRVLIVTFAKKAAQEVKERCRKVVRGPDRDDPYTQGIPKVRTLHSLGYKILEEHPEVIGYRHGISILPASKVDQFLEYGLKELPYNVRRNIPGKPIEYLESEIGKLKNDGIGPREARDQLRHKLSPAYITYQKWLHREGFVDMDDLVRLPNVLFKLSPESLKREQARYDFIMVDEFQDTNRAQFDFVAALASKHKNLAVVGDPDQSIYGFRGAKVELMVNFSKFFPEAEVVKLEDNYRSTPEIISVANTLIRNSELTGREEKILRAVRPKGIMPTLKVYDSDVEEGQAIPGEISEKIKSGERKVGDFVVIVRDRFKAERVEDGFASLEIPYQTWFTDRSRFGPTRRNAYALLALLHDEKSNTDLLQLLDSPRFGVPEDDLKNIVDYWSERELSLIEVLRKPRGFNLSRSAKHSVKKLITIVDELRGSAIPGKRKKGWMSRVSLKAFQELNPRATEDERWKSSSENIPEETKVLRKIWRKITAYEKSDNVKARNKNFSSFRQFEDEIRRRAQEGKRKQKVGEERIAVWIMSFHAAKGLEFPVVYMPNCIEDEKRQGELTFADEEKESDDLNQRDEERRLFYVGVTRAQDELHCSFPTKKIAKFGYKDKPLQPSRFLYEAGLMSELDPNGLMKF